MIRHVLIAALVLGMAGCKSRSADGEPKPGDDPKPFTLACNGQVSDDMGLVRGAVKFALTIDAANNEALLSNAGADREGILPPAYDNRNGDIVKLTMNDRLITADLNDAAREDAGNRVIIDRRTGKFAGPNTGGSCAKAALIPLPNQKF